MTTHPKSTLAAALLSLLSLLASPALAQQAPEAPNLPAGEAVKIDLPAIALQPTGKRLPGKVIWFDLLTVDAARARPFYEAVLGWTFEDRGGYAIAKDGGVPVAGMISLPARKPGAPAQPSRWMPLVSVADVGRAAAAVKNAGGRIMEGPGSLGARGRYVAVADPRGAQFVLVAAAGGDPVDADAPPPGWMWAELWTDDLKGSATFYKKVLGYEAWQIGAGNEATWIYASGGRPRARAARLPFENVTAHWLPYVLVKDLEGAIGRVTELAGHVLHRPAADGPRLAVVTDPGGAALVLEQRPDQPASNVAQAPAAGGASAAAGASAASAAGAATAGAAATAVPPPPPPPGTADPYGLDAAQQRAQQDAAAQAAADAAVGTIGIPGADVGAEAVVVAPSPMVNVWIAPPAWGPFWGPAWGSPWGWGTPWGWGAPWGWSGGAWWGMPPAWGPGFPPPYRPGGPGGFYPGYRPPPPYRPGGGYRPPPPGQRGGGYATPRPAPSYRSTPAPAYRSAPAPAYRGSPAPTYRSAPAPAPAPSRPSAPSPRR